MTRVIINTSTLETLLPTYMLAGVYKGATTHVVPREGTEKRPALCGTTPKVHWGAERKGLYATCPGCMKKFKELEDGQEAKASA